MIVVHRGFDTLHLSIQANISVELFETLEAEKAQAEEDRKSRLIDFEGIPALLEPHGGRGYRFLLNIGGMDGARWAIKKPNAKDPWGLRVMFGSDFMALRGLGAAKAHVDEVILRLGLRVRPEDISIARVDFCVDVLASGFVPIPDRFVMHSSTTRRDYVTADIKIAGKSGRVTSVTIGSPSNRQVIVYDKRAEVIQKHKPQWWRIWNDTLRRAGHPGIDLDTLRRDRDPNDVSLHNGIDPRDPAQSRIWRMEVRAGKALLKDRWGIRTWQQLFDRFGDLCREAGEVIRYTEPSDDTNRARWPNHPFWEIAVAEMNADLTEMRSGVDPVTVKEVHREQHIGVLTANAVGNLVSRAGIEFVSLDDLAEMMEAYGKEMAANVNTAPEHYGKMLRDAKDRYVFISSERDAV